MPGSYYNLDPSRVKWQCWYNDGAVGGRGFTYWYSSNTLPLSPGSRYTYSFTCTRPLCRTAKDNCNVSFDFGINSSSTYDDVGPLEIWMKNDTVSIGTPCYHSKTYLHDTRISVDLANSDHYNDAGLNTITFRNNDAYKYAIIRNLKIHRVYPMCNLTLEHFNNACGSGDCGAFQSAGTTGNLDGTRDDYPCNWNTGGRSYTYWHYPYSFNLLPGYYKEFGFTCDTPPNYLGKYACLANIDQVSLNADAAGNDAAIKLLINGNEIRRDYHSKKANHNIWPSVDVAQSNYYHDDGNNTFRIENLDANRTIQIASFDIYRIYRTDIPPHQ